MDSSDEEVLLSCCYHQENKENGKGRGSGKYLKKDRTRSLP